MGIELIFIWMVSHKGSFRNRQMATRKWSTAPDKLGHLYLFYFVKFILVVRYWWSASMQIPASSASSCRHAVVALELISLALIQSYSMTVTGTQQWTLKHKTGVTALVRQEMSTSTDWSANVLLKRTSWKKPTRKECWGTLLSREATSPQHTSKRWGKTTSIDRSSFDNSLCLFFANFYKLCLCQCFNP